MGLSSPVLSDQQFAVGRALVGSVILQEGMQRCMKEQRCSTRRPYKATLEGYYMLLLASAITLAVFTSIGFSNPNQAWAQALKDDRGTSAPSLRLPSTIYGASKNCVPQAHAWG